MRKTAHPSGGVDSSNPHRWRDRQLCHYGDVVCKVVCAFCAVLQLVTQQSGSSNSVTFCTTLVCTKSQKGKDFFPTRFFAKLLNDGLFD
jgi:hypothetical protein